MHSAAAYNTGVSGFLNHAHDFPIQGEIVRAQSRLRITAQAGFDLPPSRPQRLRLGC